MRKNHLILMRHGQSQWNLENRFTGWHDVDITEQGAAEARRGGELIRQAGFPIDEAHTSLLKRAIRTLWISLDVLDRMWVPVTRTWALNERHYGGLTGMDKKEMLSKHGEEQVLAWRRGYAVRPPALEATDPRHPRFDPRYADLGDACPATESLADTVARVVPYYETCVRPALAVGKNVLVVAHGNSLRALVMYLENMSEAEVTEFNIPTGFPMVVSFDQRLNYHGREYLGDQRAIEAAISGVKNQTGKA